MAKKVLGDGGVMTIDAASGALIESVADALPMVQTEGGEERLYKRLPYVQFISKKGQAMGKYLPILPELADGDPLLVLPDPEPPVLLKPFKFFLASYFKHYSRLDNSGYLIPGGTTLDIKVARADRSLKEHIETVILVLLADDVVPARCTFKTTKTNAAQKAIDALPEVQTAAWAGKSAEHKATLQLADPRFRYVAHVTLRPGVSRSPGAAGNAYVAADSVIKPVTATEAKLLLSCLQSQEFREECAAVNADFVKKVEGFKANVSG